MQYIKNDFCGSLFSRILQLVDTLRKWPDGSYSIPMTIYGCPDQAINNWKHGSINFTFTYPMTLTEASYGKISETNRVSHMTGGYFLNYISFFLRLVAFLPLVDNVFYNRWSSFIIIITSIIELIMIMIIIVK